MNKQVEWWQEFFDSVGTGLFRIATRKATNAQVRYIIEKMGLRKNMKVLDCPCGIGRVSIPLARKGLRVTGVDITQSYLDEFQRRLVRTDLKIPIMRADMKKITFRNEFDAVLNLWTSFGYFEDDRENFAVIRKAYQALKPGGRFLLNVINRDWIITNFETRGWDEFGGILSIQEREFDYARSINMTEWTLVKDGERVTYHVPLRMYSFHELIAMFQRAGFVDIEGFGSTKDEPIDRNRQMMWVFGTKPKR
jgi:2-polyprenyl-3-methyl-5-hydroxy-6-metoxy-1,4-benzoquinol methylase